MSQIILNQSAGTQTPTSIDGIELLNKLQQSGALDEILPPAKDDKQGGSSTELPALPKPLLAAGSSIALDILLDAIGEEVRHSETKAGIATVKANAEARETANKEKIQKIEEQIEKLEKASLWDKIGNVFKYIGMALAAVACVAMIATGVGAGVGVAGLVLLGVALADQVLDAVGEAVSGRGWGLTSLVGWGIEAATGDKEAGQWVKLGLDLALSIAAICCTCGASAGQAGANVGKIARVAQMVSKVSTGTKAATDVAGAGANIAGAVYTKDAEYARADQKRIQAILEQIQMVNDLVTKHMKQVIEDSQKIAESVTDIIKENAATQTAILTGGGATPTA